MPPTPSLGYYSEICIKYIFTLLDSYTTNVSWNNVLFNVVCFFYLYVSINGISLNIFLHVFFLLFPSSILKYVSLKFIYFHCDIVFLVLLYHYLFIIYTVYEYLDCNPLLSYNKQCCYEHFCMSPRIYVYEFL